MGSVCELNGNISIAQMPCVIINCTVKGPATIWSSVQIARRQQTRDRQRCDLVMFGRCIFPAVMGRDIDHESYGPMRRVNEVLPFSGKYRAEIQAHTIGEELVEGTISNKINWNDKKKGAEKSIGIVVAI